MSLHEGHWAAQQERGHKLFLTLTKLMVRYLPAPIMRACIAVIVVYFYLTSPQQRRNIKRYHTRLQAQFDDVVLPTGAVFWHFVSFGKAIADRFAVWQHQIRYEHLVVEDPDNIYAEVGKRSGRGQIFVCSHVGNVEVCRALVQHHQGFRLNVLVHSRHAEAFNRALVEAGADEIQLIQVMDLDAALMLELNRRLDAGEWIAIAADRVPVRGDKTVGVQFLGKEAQMPQGVWLLAALLKAPVHSLFCIWQEGAYHLKLQRFLASTDWPRQQRAAAVAQAAQDYANRLAAECRRNPLQWFNFYDFWKDE